MSLHLLYNLYSATAPYYINTVKVSFKGRRAGNSCYRLKYYEKNLV